MGSFSPHVGPSGSYPSSDPGEQPERPDAAHFLGLGYAPSTAKLYAAAVNALLSKGYDGSEGHAVFLRLSAKAAQTYRTAWNAWKRGTKLPLGRPDNVDPLGLVYRGATGRAQRRLLHALHDGLFSAYQSADPELQAALVRYAVPRHVREALAHLATARGLSPSELHRMRWGWVRLTRNRDGFVVCTADPVVPMQGVDGLGPAAYRQLLFSGRKDIEAIQNLFNWAAPVSPLAPLVPQGGGSAVPMSKREIRRMVRHAAADLAPDELEAHIADKFALEIRRG